MDDEDPAGIETVEGDTDIELVPDDASAVAGIISRNPTINMINSEDFIIIKLND